MIGLYGNVTVLMHRLVISDYVGMKLVMVMKYNTIQYNGNEIV